MKVSQLLESRRGNWRQLDELCRKLEQFRRIPAPVVARFASLYRAVCADLALAESYQLPPSTVDYLHQLVGRAHNQIYRSQRFRIRMWMAELLYAVPAQLYADRYIRVASVLFWGLFAMSMWLASDASPAPDFAVKMVGEDNLRMYEEMYVQAKWEQDLGGGTGMTGFYQSHNTTIGLRVFAHGLLFGIGGILETVRNAAYLGAVFGYMTTVPDARDNFFQFVTAHGPFELTAIVLAAGVGMKLGFALLFTGGLTRGDSVRLAGKSAMPAMGVAMILFLLAALIEGYISPSALPYEIKALFGAGSSLVLMIYFVVLGSIGRTMIADAENGESGRDL
ncbi:MAG: stage II sporulation protein M [Planctomycetota bacterium]|nr:MAG: stage II sporulation protein M [Planctomycetota bacterium]